MMFSRSPARALVVLALLLAGCAETQLIAHTAKQVQDDDELGAYKVGQPYKINGTWYYPAEDYTYVETGIASWYGPGFHGKRTANGERYDQDALTAAHRTLPMPQVRLRARYTSTNTTAWVEELSAALISRS